MLSSRRFALAFCLALASIPAVRAADEPQPANHAIGKILAADLCGAHDDYRTFDRLGYDHVASQLAQFVLDCNADENLYLLNPVEAGYKVVAAVKKGTPEASFFGYHGVSNGVKVTFVADEQTGERTELGLALFHQKSAVCGESSHEVKFQAASVKQNGRGLRATHELQFSPVLGTDVCLPSSAPTEKLAGLKIVDWAFSPDKASFDVVTLTSGWGGESTVAEGLHVFRVDVLTFKAKLLAFIPAEKFEETGCGAYLNGVRLLPGTSKVALFYKLPRIVLVDIANPEAPVFEEKYKEELGGAATCEGYTPDYDSLRSQELGSWVEIDEQFREIHLVARRRVAIPGADEWNNVRSVPAVISINY